MGLHEDLQAAWGTTEFLGPVLTDFKGAKKDVKLVIVCESPSYHEVDEHNRIAIRPANGVTGAKIAKAVQRFDPAGKGVRREDLPKLGYYITNLVRYRADAGLKDGSSDPEPYDSDPSTELQQTRRTAINRRLRSAWEAYPALKDGLVKELASIALAQAKVRVLFACGKYGFLGRMVTEIMSSEGLAGAEWMRVRHPSRWTEQHYELVAPDRWRRLIRANHDGVYQVCHGLKVQVRKAR